MVAAAQALAFGQRVRFGGRGGEITAVQPNRGGSISGVERGLERRDVGIGDVVRERDDPGIGHDPRRDIRRQQGPQHVEIAPQVRARRLLVVVRPEREGDGVARLGSARGEEIRQQVEGAALPGDRDGPAVDAHARRAQHLKLSRHFERG